MNRRIALVALAVLPACTPAQVTAYLDLGPDDRTAVVEHVVRSAADEMGADPDLMVRIARCESGLRADAVNRESGALGLFQHLPQYWGRRAEAMGYDYDSWYDPTANARVSARMLADGGPAPWYASRHCWEMR